MAKILFGLIFFLLVSSSNVFAVSTPTLESPSNGSQTSDTTPTLRWNWTGTCTTSGSCFLVQVDDQVDFSSLNKERYTSNTSYSPELSTGTWYWQVKAKDSTNTWSGWSEAWNFTITQEASPTPTPTTSPTPADGVSITLSEFMPNPQDADEWVEIKNLGNSTTDVSGYKIDDIEGGSSPFTIPQGTTIGSDGFAVFYFSARLNNGGDTVRLLNSDGNILESYTYSSSTKGVSFAKDANGNWRETQTPTPGSANQITTPTTSSDSSSGETSKSKISTTGKTPTPTATSQVLGKKVSGARVTTITQDNLATPSLILATESTESSPEAQIAGESKSNLGAILVIFGGLAILLEGGIPLAKKLGWKL